MYILMIESQLGVPTNTGTRIYASLAYGPWAGCHSSVCSFGRFIETIYYRNMLKSELGTQVSMFLSLLGYRDGFSTSGDAPGDWKCIVRWAMGLLNSNLEHFQERSKASGFSAPWRLCGRSKEKVGVGVSHLWI